MQKLDNLHSACWQILELILIVFIEVQQICFKTIKLLRDAYLYRLKKVFERSLILGWRQNLPWNPIFIFPCIKRLLIGYQITKMEKASGFLPTMEIDSCSCITFRYVGQLRKESRTFRVQKETFKFFYLILMPWCSFI